MEVFVLTHKRPEFLKQTLDCYLKQTVKGFRLAVFSNGHSPETKRLLNEYARYGVEDFYVDEELAPNVNHARALEASGRKLLVVAHDDDLVHQAYVEHLLALFNKFPDTALAVSRSEEFSPEKLCASPARRAWRFKTRNEFAAWVFSGGGFTFSSACYKTQHVKRTDPFVAKSYGKVGDVPFMLAVCAEGEAVLTDFPFVQYRIHAGQDSYNYATGPSAEEWLNLTLLYKHLLCRPEQPGLRRLFLLQNYRCLRIGWRDWTKCEHGKMTWKDFKALALERGALCEKAVWAGRLLRGKVNHALQRYSARFSQTDY